MTASKRSSPTPLLAKRQHSVGLVVAQDVDAEAAGRRHRLPRVAGDLRQEADERRVERHRRERPDREPGRLVAGPPGDDRDAGGEVPEHLAELGAVERGDAASSGSAVIDVDGRHGVRHSRHAGHGSPTPSAPCGPRCARSAGASPRPGRSPRPVGAHLGADRRLGAIWARASEPGRRPVRVMLFESLPTEPDTAAWSTWCRRARARRVHARPSTVPTCASSPVTRPGRARRRRRAGAGLHGRRPPPRSGRRPLRPVPAAACAPTASPSARRSPSSSSTTCRPSPTTCT